MHYYRLITVPVLFQADDLEELETAIDELVGDITAQACESAKGSPFTWVLASEGVSVSSPLDL